MYLDKIIKAYNRRFYTMVTITVVAVITEIAIAGSFYVI